MAKANRGGKYATSNNIIQFPQKEKSSSQRTAASILKSVDANLQKVETALSNSDNDTSYLLTYRRRLRALRNKIIKSERL